MGPGLNGPGLFFLLPVKETPIPHRARRHSGICFPLSPLAFSRGVRYPRDAVSEAVERCDDHIAGIGAGAEVTRERQTVVCWS